MTSPETTRRSLLTGLAAAGAAVPVLAACGNEGGSGGATGTTSESATAGGSAGGSGGSGGTGGGIRTADIPVGGGKVFGKEKIVVTQPAAGEFKAFSAICTHQGCPVGSVGGGTINCPCHGSKFSIEDGSVEEGPATNGLAAKTVAVSGDTLTVS